MVDLKKLVKYEQKSKVKATPAQSHSRTRLAPENIINVTIVNESSPQKDDPATKAISTEPRPENSTHQNKETQQPDVSSETKQSKRLLRLPKHIKTRNPKIVYKTGISRSARSGQLIRNTPTDLYQKYQEDWMKFRAFIPGESNRTQLRRSIRRKMQQRDDDDNAKVSWINIFFKMTCCVNQSIVKHKTH